MTESEEELKGLLKVKEESEKAKGNPLTLLVVMQTSTGTMENSVEIP